MKKEIVLSKEEKINFLAMLEHSRVEFDIINQTNNLKKWAIFGGIVAVLGGSLTVLGVVLSGIGVSTMLSVVLPIDIIGSLTIISATNFNTIKHLLNNKKLFSEETNGKITYKDYKKLLKTGEINKWKSEYKKEI